MCNLEGAVELSADIWMVVVDQLEYPWDIAALSRACRWLHGITNHLLYQHAVKYGFDLRAMFWAIRYRLPGALRHVLEAGANTNMVWVYFDPRPGPKFTAVPTFDECLGTVPEGVQFEFSLIYPRPYCSPLHLATLLGDIEIIGMLLDYGADLYAGSCRVCSCYDIQDNIDPEITSDFRYQSLSDPRWTPYHISICAGHIHTVELLSSRGGGIEMQSIDPYRDVVYSGLTPIHVASISGQSEMLGWILMNADRDIDVDAFDACGRTALLYAYYAGHWDCVVRLIRSGADINRYNRVSFWEETEGYGPDIRTLNRHRNSVQGTILADSITPSRFEDALRLLDLGADPVIADQAVQNGLPLIHRLCFLPWYTNSHDGSRKESRAINEAGLKLLKHFLALGLDFRRSVTQYWRRDPPIPGHTALGHAAGSGNLLAAQRLIEAGANVDGNPDVDLCTPLTRACEWSNAKPVLEMVTLLVSSGASVNKLRAQSRAPLWALICRFGDPYDDEEEHMPDQLQKEVIDLLLGLGSNPWRGTSCGDRSYQTALDYHLLNGEFDKLNYLVSNSTKGSYGDDDILSLWNIAIRFEDQAYLQCVINLDERGLLARMEPMALLAVLSRHPVDLELVTRLLEQGADPNINHRGRNPLECIITQASTETSRKLSVIRTLLESGASIFQELGPSVFTNPVAETPFTPLGLAIHLMQPAIGILEALLEHKPLRDAPDIDPFKYILYACIVGNTEALSALISSLGPLTSGMLAKANITIHQVLDNVPQTKTTIREINTVIDCLHILVQNGASLSVLAQLGSDDHRIAREKLARLCDEEYFCTENKSKSRAITWCFQQRSDFSGKGDLSFFKGDTMELFFQLHISLEQLGRILGDNSRTWALRFGTGSLSERAINGD
ncbi:unnamed protein product [Clonostachys solani]|uniref:Ankyrin n=1 Tax=Clonostachys solani TaxID=160281 RepID=A0A9P0E9N0_9HYPO|nr:unnamed protein product [Clonostachys solani]